MRPFQFLGLCAVLLGCPMSGPGGGGGAGLSDAGPGVDVGSAQDTGTTPTTESVTIAELRGGTVAEESQVRIEGAVVTAIQPGRGLWVQQGSGPDSGLFLFGEEAAATEGLSEGTQLTVSGVFTVFNDLKQIKFPTLTELQPGTLPEPFVVSAADLATSPSWEGVLVQANTVTIVNPNPDGPDNDYGQIELNDGLIMDDDVFRDLDSGRYFLRQEGTVFNSVVGIAHLSFGKRKILPRRAADLDVVGGAPDFTVTVQQIQQGERAEDSPVRITGAVVTALTPSSETRYRGLWVQQGRGPHSGIYVFFGSSDLPDVTLGDQVDVEGTYSEFYGQSQVVRATVSKTGQGVLPEPSWLTSAELAGAADGDNHSTAEPWEGVLVGVRDVSLTVVNPNSDDGALCPDGDDECKDYGSIGVTSGLRVTARLWPDLSAGTHFARETGVTFSSIVGIAEEAFGHHGLAPRTLTDVIVQD